MPTISDFAPAFVQRPGGYRPDVPFEEYKALPAINASLLKKHTALEMEDAITADDEELTESRAVAYATGHCAHLAILQPHLFESDDRLLDFFAYSPTKGLMTEKAKMARLADPKRLLVTPEIIETARRTRDAVHRHHWADRLLTNCDTELSGEAWDPEFEVMRKIRVDCRGGVGANYLLDLKSTRDTMSIEDTRRTCWKLGYHLQASFYLDSDKLITGEERSHFYFLFFTTSKPFMARLFLMHTDFIAKGRDLYKERMGMLCQAWHDSQWCAYEHEEEVMLQA